MEAEHPGEEAPRIVRDFESRVARWAWSHESLLWTDELPLQRELSGRPALVPALERPADRTPYTEYGFDGEGHCILARKRSFAEYDGDKVIEQQFLSYRPGGRHAARYEAVGPRWDLAEVNARTFDGDALVSHEAIDRFANCWSMQYEYANGVLVARTYDDSAGRFWTERVLRGADGSVEALVRDDELVWTAKREDRLPDRQHLVSLLERDVARAIASAGGGPWWIVLLRYSEDGQHWRDAALPTLSLAAIEDRDRLTQLARESWEDGWDWLEWTVPELQVDLAADTSDASRLLDGVVGVEEAPAVLRRVAERLGSRADAEVCVAADWELRTLTDALEGLASHQQRVLRTAGMLPS